MKKMTVFLLCWLYSSMVFSASPADGIYILLSSAESSLSVQDGLTRFYELPRLIIVNGEITDLRGEFFYPSHCNPAADDGKARLDLSKAKALKQEDGVFYINKEFSMYSEQPGDYRLYGYGALSQELITAFSLYGRDVVYGILRFESPTEAVYSLTSAQAFFTGKGLDVGTCITQETARLVKIQ